MDKGLTIRSIDDIERIAKVAVASSYTACRKWEEAAMLILTGHELGLSPAQSLRGIYVVSGKPVLSADLMVAVVRRSGLCASWRVVESTAERCTITTLRQGESEPSSRTWTLADAKRAGITGKGTWNAYPAAMLRHRCASDLAREVYPDVLLGLYDPEEMGVDAAPAAPAISLDALGVEEKIGALPSAADTLARDLADSAAQCDSINGIAALWRAASADVRALSDRAGRERCWSAVVARAEEIGASDAALRAALKETPATE